MTDIVERLRAAYQKREILPWSDIYDASDEIERLTAALQEIASHNDVALTIARRALEPKP